MSDGIYLNGRRPKSKKAVKEAIHGLPVRLCDAVRLECTSLFGPRAGRIDKLVDLPDGRYDFVGPDPNSDRRFYGSLTISEGMVKVQ